MVMKILLARHFETEFLAISMPHRTVFVSAGDILVYQDGKLYKAELKPVEEEGDFKPELYIPEPGAAGEIRRIVEGDVLKWETPYGKIAVGRIVQI